MNIVFDIETIPTQEPRVKDLIANGITPPAALKKAESIAEWHANQKQTAIDEAIAKTSFDGAYGQICCIGWAIDDNDVMHVVGDEKTGIEIFFSDVASCIRKDMLGGGSISEKPVFIGHNLAAFDFRFLFQRAVIHGIKPPACIPFNAKAWDAQIFDTMTYFAGFGNRISLDKLAKALGLSGKGEFTGADVWPLYQAGKIAEIAEYCCDDVRLTREVYKRLTFQKNES